MNLGMVGGLPDTPVRGVSHIKGGFPLTLGVMIHELPLTHRFECSLH